MDGQDFTGSISGPHRYPGGRGRQPPLMASGPLVLLLLSLSLSLSLIVDRSLDATTSASEWKRKGRGRYESRHLGPTIGRRRRVERADADGQDRSTSDFGQLHARTGYAFKACARRVGGPPAVAGFARRLLTDPVRPGEARRRLRSTSLGYVSHCDTTTTLVVGKSPWERKRMGDGLGWGGVVVGAGSRFALEASINSIRRPVYCRVGSVDLDQAKRTARTLSRGLAWRARKHYDITNLDEMLFKTMDMSAVYRIDPTVVISLFFSDPFEPNRPSSSTCRLGDPHSSPDGDMSTSSASSSSSSPFLNVTSVAVPATDKDEVHVPVEIVSEEEMAFLEAALASTRSLFSSSPSPLFSSACSSASRFALLSPLPAVLSRSCRPQSLATTPNIEDFVPPRSSLLRRFRFRRGLSVTDIIGTTHQCQEWCEKQMEFALTHGKPARTVAMKAGSDRHSQLEKEVSQSTETKMQNYLWLCNF
ncbi:hypothetical protein B296_00025113 [Ensete ventricosum]|uniref:Uncharacterized protein n=1 Tax=Ensete ventricosum TaxID=4639 RepID=A0A426YIZ2_ENSVE|nr:hypothetical protein B296_00025113 [Ensete ventricosum]